MTTNKTEDIILSAIKGQPHEIKDPGVARLVIDGNKVVGENSIKGLNVHVKELTDGVDVDIKLDDNCIIEKPVHLCFGVTPKKGKQKIIMNVDIGKHSKINIQGHCTFPNAVDVQHIMNGKINVGEGAEYAYMERHYHSDYGGTKVYPHATINVGKNARFRTEFELLKGRVGLIDINYYMILEENALAEMTSRINGSQDDKIIISESAELNGEYAKGVLTSKVAVRNEASAEIHNKIIANAAHSRGHVDCKEIVKDNAIATAIPIVDVRNAKAHVTHEAVVGDVDKKQLETLLSRGLNEDQASELIIQGLLSA